jgi:hypothetical protein
LFTLMQQKLLKGMYSNMTREFEILKEFLESEEVYDLYLFNLEKVDPYKLGSLEGSHLKASAILVSSFPFSQSYEGNRFWTELWLKLIGINL